MIVPKFAEVLCEKCDVSTGSLQSLKQDLNKFKSQNDHLDLFNLTLDLLVDFIENEPDSSDKDKLFYQQQMVDATVGDPDEIKQFTEGYNKLVYFIIKEKIVNKFAYSLVCLLTRSFMFMSSSWSKMVVGATDEGKFIETERPLDKKVKDILTKKKEGRDLSFIENSLLGSVLPFVMSCGIVSTYIRSEIYEKLFYTSFSLFNYEVSHVSKSPVRESLLETREQKIKESTNMLLDPLLVDLKDDSVFDRVMVYPMQGFNDGMSYGIRISGVGGINYHFIYDLEDGKLWSVFDFLELYFDKEGIFELNKTLKGIALDVLYFVLCREKKSTKWNYAFDKPVLYCKNSVDLSELFEQLKGLAKMESSRLVKHSGKRETLLQGVN